MKASRTPSGRLWSKKIGERALYELLSLDEARHVDELVELSTRSSSEVLAALFDLELKGVVRQLPGKQFLKVLL